MSDIRFDHYPGPDPAIVMIHGWTCRRSDWNAQIDHLNGRHEMLALDLPGHGDSPVDERAQWTMQAFAGDVVDCLQKLASETVVIMGHSMGGTVALEAAALAPERVKGVILADTFLINYGALTAEEITGFYQPFSDDFHSAMDTLIENTTGPDTGDELKSRLKRQMGEADPAWALAAWEQLLNWNPAPVWPKLKCPVHAINCPLIPDTTRERLGAHMSETVIPGSGHFLQMEVPAAFNAAMDDAIRRF
ncbi:alpha/beta fold hydrolase [Natronospira bacteriovora]|uniref:Alpha/beta hydrolase n=1 Tax=Natronospira bacteriovora TaxID=3069753 RepID=A0ABU0W319_9GAMM|nr:alpha/beta hydrolase [Natronospira sp. AB-CW4]MDQ2068403.1 alpha/beta hydrolase [Natronospira sp. AB-CW4]